MVIDVKCDSTDIFSCVFICTDLSSSDIIGIASDKNEEEIVILVNNVSEKTSVSYRAASKDILKGDKANQ